MTEPSAAPADLPVTLGELRASGWRSIPVREEIRDNVLRKLADHEPIVSGVLGFDDSVLPQLEHALIAGHDVIFLGERGQAKSRMIRALANLLDEWAPIVAGSEINDDPYAPISRHARNVVAAQGEDTPIAWVHRSRRYAEKLATPDTAIADLIGEVDPIKVAEGRYLSDELTIHYGLVPRTNRGIFAINELPDLAERIQVGLLDVLEERDVQIRGYAVRLPLDVLLVASANPEDYTSRGRIITPLKDRFGAQIRTHYPRDLATEIAIVLEQAETATARDVEVVVPASMAEVVARVTHLARASSKVNQRSGVSVRASVANYETLAAAAIRRAVLMGETVAVPRVSDLPALLASTLGKLEIESFDNDEDAEVIEQIVNAAVLQVFRDVVPSDQLGAIVAAFDEGLTAELGSLIDSSVHVALTKEIPELDSVVGGLVPKDASPAEIASAVELVLEGLHLSRRLNKDVFGDVVSYGAS